MHRPAASVTMRGRIRCGTIDGASAIGTLTGVRSSFGAYCVTSTVLPLGECGKNQMALSARSLIPNESSSAPARSIIPIAPIPSPALVSIGEATGPRRAMWLAMRLAMWLAGAVPDDLEAGAYTPGEAISRPPRESVGSVLDTDAAGFACAI